jgi:DNA-directed RNA polymerase subunit RPC12/RpoP
MYTCDKCDKEFLTKKGYNYHVMHNSCKITAKIQCEYCGKGYTTKQSLDRHLKNACKGDNAEKI